MTFVNIYFYAFTKLMRQLNIAIIYVTLYWTSELTKALRPLKCHRTDKMSHLIVVLKTELQ